MRAVVEQMNYSDRRIRERTPEEKRDGIFPIKQCRAGCILRAPTAEEVFGIHLQALDHEFTLRMFPSILLCAITEPLRSCDREIVIPLATKFAWEINVQHRAGKVSAVVRSEVKAVLSSGQIYARRILPARALRVQRRDVKGCVIFQRA